MVASVPADKHFLMIVLSKSDIGAEIIPTLCGTLYHNSIYWFLTFFVSEYAEENIVRLAAHRKKIPSIQRKQIIWASDEDPKTRNPIGMQYGMSFRRKWHRTH
jgi:hypothetical protein